MHCGESMSKIIDSLHSDLVALHQAGAIDNAILHGLEAAINPQPCPSNAFNPPSSRMVTPSSCAFFSLLPASSPDTT
ncbi:Uncharacterised protein [Bordetella ansorpii]|uniref:Uncharacterized protein n=1 Tax=Bordetella ansorpii TaxID=288768 RepID=A0A157PRG5_9BORD|nr:Uncharacterised protein [Bordetella ansorpii]